MKRTNWGLVLAGMLLPAGAQAEFSYTFIEASYLNITRSEFEPSPLNEENGQGFDLGASLDISDHLFAFLDYRELDLHHDIDVTLWNPGLGLHFGLSDSVDLALKAGYVRGELNSPLVDVEDNGFNAGFALRAHILKMLEAEVGARYCNLDMASGDEINFNALLRYYFTKGLALQAGVLFDSDRDPTWLVGFRTEFPRLL